MSVIHPAIMALWSHQQRPRSFMERAITIHRMSVPIGMALLTLMESVSPRLGVQVLDGASRSGSVIPMAILITILGGGHGVTTALAAGDPHGATATEATPPRMFMGAGEIRRINIRRPPGLILIPATMAQELARLFKTLSAAQWESPVVGPIQTSTREIRTLAGGQSHTTPKQGLLPAEGQDTQAISIAVKGPPVEVVLPITRIPEVA